MQQITLKDNFMRKKYYICPTEDKYKSGAVRIEKTEIIGTDDKEYDL